MKNPDIGLVIEEYRVGTTSGVILLDVEPILDSFVGRCGLGRTTLSLSFRFLEWCSFAVVPGRDDVPLPPICLPISSSSPELWSTSSSAGYLLRGCGRGRRSEWGYVDEMERQLGPAVGGDGGGRDIGKDRVG